jgi:hypothetical protein
MTQCPDHMRKGGATLGDCRECAREADTADHAAGAANAKAALRAAPRPPHATEPPKPDPVRDLAIVRARADREAKP